MEPHEFKKLLDKYSKGECNAAEEKIIQEWYDNIGRKSHQPAKEAAAPEVEARIWSKIKPRSSAPGRNHFFYLISAAATFLALAVIGLGLYLTSGERVMSQPGMQADINEKQNNSLTLETNTGGEAREITLPDKSSVTLKPGSELRFSKDFTGNKREVYLSGEAFFNVQKDAARPFLVYSNEVITKVLGTSFNVRAYANDKEVTVVVKTGKVSVYANTDSQADADVETAQPEVILTPNYQVVYNRHKDRVYKQVVEVPELILPQPTLFEMQYDGVPVSRIFEALEENYGVDIDFDEEQLKNCMLTTSMSDEGFYERIEIICKAIGAEYIVTDAVIAVKSNGCQ